MVKTKTGELKDDFRKGFSWRLSKEFTDLVEETSGNRRFLVRFQYGCEKDMTLKQPTAVNVDRIPMTKYYKVTTIYTKPEEEDDLEKVCYHGVYVF